MLMNSAVINLYDFSDLTRGATPAQSNVVMSYEIEALQNEVADLRDRRRRDRHRRLNYIRVCHYKEKFKALLIVRRLREALLQHLISLPRYTIPSSVHCNVNVYRMR